MRKLAIVLGLTLFFLPVFAFAQLTPENSGLTATGDQIYGSGAETDVTVLIGGFIRVAMSFLGILFLGLMLYAGILWMTAGGNPEQVKKAKNLMLNAVLGLVIILSSYVITEAIITGLTAPAANTSGVGTLEAPSE